MRVVLDTNVVVAALRSDEGASAVILRAALNREITNCLSVALYLEYEEVLKRDPPLNRTAESINAVLSSILRNAATYANVPVVTDFEVRDPDDLFLVSLTTHAAANHLVTHNVRDLDRSRGISVVTPAELLQIMRSQ
jgi:putative PIN family toxin of toxin-antitoxin system